MGIADLWRRLHDSKLREIAFRVAKQCQREVLAKVEIRACSMSDPQARGYIKARAGLLIERVLKESLTAGRGMSAARYARLEGIALEAVCGLVQMEMASRKLVPATVRRAA